MRRVIPLLLSCLALAQSGDGVKTLTTYSKAYGASKGSPKVDAAKELPRYPAVPPDEAGRTWTIKEGFRMELAAHEPAVRSPVALCFDERGRMFVCEMIDYSEMRDVKPHLGRISVLEDRDGDGRYETSKVFADDLPWPTGLIWADRGLYVAATPDIIRLEDRDDDGRAEVRKVAFTGFGTGLKILNVQGLANSLQWGPDQRVHVLAGGGNRGKVSSPLRPDQPAVELGGRDFWFEPRTHAFGLEPGGAQYGMSYDDLGRKYGCSNSDHLQHWTHEEPDAGLNPVAPLPSGRRSIAVDGGAAEVFRISPDEPWRIIRTRWRISGAVPGTVEGGGRVSGYFTGATGTTVYRGDAYGSAFVGNTFTGDAGGQLAHRKVLTRAVDGVGMSGARPSDEKGREFAASRDTWVRVVNFANAPDGCLHLIDMYREVIEHPWSIPEEIKQHIDLNSGNDRGRIWRIVPAGGRPARGGRVVLHEAGFKELVDTLSHENGWHRDTAARLLIEKASPASRPLLIATLEGHKDARARLTAFNVLRRLGWVDGKTMLTALRDGSAEVKGRALLTLRRDGAPETEGLGKVLASLAADTDARVRFELALTAARLADDADALGLGAVLRTLAIRDHSHPWIAPAVLSARPSTLSRVVLPGFMRDRNLSLSAKSFVGRLLETAPLGLNAESHDDLLDFALADGGEVEWLRPLDAGLRRTASNLTKADKAGHLKASFVTAAKEAVSGDLAARRRALSLLALSDFSRLAPALDACAGKDADGSLRELAVQSAARFSGAASAEWLTKAFFSLDGPAKDAAFTALRARPERLESLLKALENGAATPGALSAGQMDALVRSSDPSTAARAAKALAGLLPPTREAVARTYAGSADMTGDAAKGRTICEQRCLICHQAEGKGKAVGPALVTVKTRGRSG
ncbi:MAG: PVC-type heme-binding CxxCH protein, partial [Verrucomicrobiota bacterium]